MNFWNFQICVVSAILGCIYGFETPFLNVTTLLNYSWRLAEASNTFGFNLLAELASETSSNVVISPISVSTTFGLIYYGSKGKTEKELETLLGYKSLNMTKTEVSRAFQFLLTEYLISVDPRAYVLDLASVLFVNQNLGLNPTFKAAAEKYFLSHVENTSFIDGQKAVKKINDMVRNKTKEKICGIVDTLDSSVDLVAVNALYFKSKWYNYFPEGNTKQGIFYNGGKVETSVQMMHQEGTLLHYQDEELAMVHMGFRGDNMSMLFLLPHQKDGLLNLEKTLTQSKLVNYLLNAIPRTVALTLPKFNLSYSNDLGPSMQKLGAMDIFEPSHANLTDMIKDEGIAIGEVRHKTTIEVNEAGVEASGVTASISFRSLPIDDSPLNVTVDHPFMFMIYDERTNLAILVGRVWNL